MILIYFFTGIFMLYKTKKKLLFFLGVLFTGLSGLISGYMRTNYSKEDSSLFTPTANADVAPWAWGYGDGGGAGDGCGGCSGDTGAGGS